MRTKKKKEIQTLHMETTKIAPEKTIVDIQNELRKYNLRRFNSVYDENGDIEAVFFTIMIEGSELPYQMPARYEALLELARRGETKHLKPGDVEQAKRIAWRIVYRWVQAQLAFTRSGMVKIQEVFLSYIFDTEKNQTLFEKFEDMKYPGYLITAGKQEKPQDS